MQAEPKVRLLCNHSSSTIGWQSKRNGDGTIARSARRQESPRSNADQLHTKQQRKDSLKDRRRHYDCRRYCTEVSCDIILSFPRLHPTHRLSVKFGSTAEEDSPQTHANPIADQPTPMNPGTTPLPQEVIEEEDCAVYFENSCTRIAPPDWELHESTDFNGQVQSFWTYTNAEDITTYTTDDTFEARYPSELKLWHVCHYQWFQTNTLTSEETHICDFYANLATQLTHYENPMHQYLAQQLI